VIRAGVVGATGYVGAELLRWLSLHPEVSDIVAVSRSRAGVDIDLVLPGLQGLIPGAFEPLDPDRLSQLDVVFLATPHGQAAPLAARLDPPVLIDCSADHRHAEGWVYGQPEWHGEALSGACRVAAPGCFATAMGLALAPFAAAGLSTGPAMITAATGSTGSGVQPSRGTHHPERFANLRAYKVLTHQHPPEVAAFLEGLGGGPPIHFVPLSAPVDRGILASVLLPLGDDVDATQLVSDAYRPHPLVRVRSGSPELRHVRGTAFADLAVTQRDGVASVLVAIDNLGKGAAAQAVQAMNLTQGLPTDRGLRWPAATP